MPLNLRMVPGTTQYKPLETEQTVEPTEEQVTQEKPKLTKRWGKWFETLPDGKMRMWRGEEPEEEAKTTVKPPPISQAQPKAKAGQSPLEANVTQAEIANRFASGFNFAAWFVKSDAQFEAAEFRESARNLIELINLFPALKIVLRLLGPAFAVVDIAKAVRDVSEGMKRRQQREKAGIADPNAVGTQPKQPF